jgi:hypothetical protein
MSAPSLPEEVLTDALAEAIGGRHVRAAVFTTYSFDPGFFELHVLPVLFSRSFSQVEKVRRIQLEDALRSVGEIAVYYDRTALSQDALPAQLDFRRIDVRRATGVFHPKLALLLVENREAEGEDAEPRVSSLNLIVAVLSANLTRSGWWENVEAGHIKTIQDWEDDGARYPFRKDLLSLIRRIKGCAPDDETHPALDQIQDFLLRRVSTAQTTYNSAKGRWHTRIFCGQTNLPDWLNELRLGRRDWNLEIVSPFLDADDPSALRALIEALQPRETRVYLPTDAEGRATVTEQTWQAVGKIATWGSLPASLRRPGARVSIEALPPRYVHAKVYRLWRGGESPQAVTLVGSVNLTTAGHSHGGAGNLEAAFFVDMTDDLGRKQWWLEPVEKKPIRFAESDSQETDAGESVFVDLSLSFDWRTGELRYRSQDRFDGAIEVCELSGRLLFALRGVRPGGWKACDEDAAKAIRGLLLSSSFVLLKTPAGSWRALVREEGMSHRPSLLASLTPDEILMYWSLLSPEQQEWFIEQKLTAGATLEGLAVGSAVPRPISTTVFDRFSGVYHAFERMYRCVDEAIHRGEEKEASARIFGEKYDSLPVLLRAVLDQKDRDGVISYVTFLCARQVCDRLRRSHPDFEREHREESRQLRALVEQSAQLRAALQLDGEEEGRAFLDWYEEMFLRETPVPEDVP